MVMTTPSQSGKEKMNHSKHSQPILMNQCIRYKTHIPTPSISKNLMRNLHAWQWYMHCQMTMQISHLWSSSLDCWTGSHSKTYSMLRKQTVDAVQHPPHEWGGLSVVSDLWSKSKTCRGRTNLICVFCEKLGHCIHIFQTVVYLKTKEESIKIQDPKASRMQTKQRKQLQMIQQCNQLTLKNQVSLQAEQVETSSHPHQLALTKNGMQTLGPLLIWALAEIGYATTNPNVSQ